MTCRGNFRYKYGKIPGAARGPLHRGLGPEEDAGEGRGGGPRDHHQLSHQRSVK